MAEGFTAGSKRPRESCSRTARGSAPLQIGWVQVQPHKISALAPQRSGELNFVHELAAVKLFNAKLAGEHMEFSTNSGLKLSLATTPAGSKLVLAPAGVPRVGAVHWTGLDSPGALRCLEHAGQRYDWQAGSTWTAVQDATLHAAAADLCPTVPWTHGLPGAGADTAELAKVLHSLHAIAMLDDAWHTASWKELVPGKRGVVWRLSMGASTCIVKVQVLDERTYMEMAALQACAGSTPGLPSALAACILGQQAVLLVLPDAGETVQARMPVHPATAMEWGAALCDRLAVMHKAGWAHLDVHPENVCLSATGGIGLIDAGSAQQLQPRGTQPAAYVGPTRGGLWSFSPPEQLEFRGPVTLSAGVDVFTAAGMVCWMLSGGEPPFGPKSGPLKRWNTIQHERRQPTALEAWVFRICAHVPTSVAPALLKALAPDPAERGSAAELQRQLAAAVEVGATR